MVMLSMHQSPAFIREALAAGALGYVLKTAPITDLIEAVRAVARGPLDGARPRYCQWTSTRRVSRNGTPLLIRSCCGHRPPATR